MSSSEDHGVGSTRRVAAARHSSDSGFDVAAADDNVVVEYVALEDFLMDQDTGLVVETTTDHGEEEADKFSDELRSDPGGLAGNDQYLRMLPTTPVPVQVVRPQQQQQLEEDEPQDLVKRPRSKVYGLRTSARPSVVPLFDQDSSRTSSLEALADAAASVVVGQGLRDDDALSHAAAAAAAAAAAEERRRRRNPIPEDLKDQRYWERRIKNNVAAKRSRETKREKENQLSVKVALLEKEHAILMSEIQSTRTINQELRDRLSKYEPVVQSTSQ